MSQEPFVFPNLWRPFPFDLWVFRKQKTKGCVGTFHVFGSHFSRPQPFAVCLCWVDWLTLHLQSDLARKKHDRRPGFILLCCTPKVAGPGIDHEFSVREGHQKKGQNEECGLIYYNLLTHFQIVKRLVILPKIHQPAVLLTSTRRHGSNYYSDAKPGALGQHSASEIYVPGGSRAKYCEVLGDHSLAGWSLLEECHEYLLVSRWECDIAVAEFPTALTLSDMQMSPFASSTRTMATGIEPRP